MVEIRQMGVVVVVMVGRTAARTHHRAQHRKLLLVVVVGMRVRRVRGRGGWVQRGGGRGGGRRARVARALSAAGIQPDHVLVGDGRLRMRRRVRVRHEGLHGRRGQQGLAGGRCDLHAGADAHLSEVPLLLCRYGRVLAGAGCHPGPASHCRSIRQRWVRVRKVCGRLLGGHHRVGHGCNHVRGSGVCGGHVAQPGAHHAHSGQPHARRRARRVWPARCGRGWRPRRESFNCRVEFLRVGVEGRLLEGESHSGGDSCRTLSL